MYDSGHRIGMKSFIVSFYSDSDAVAGERKLLDAGMDARLIPAPPEAGSGVSLAVESSDMGKVKLLLGETVRDIRPKDSAGRGLWDP